MEWKQYVDKAAASADSAPRKCLERACVEGLDAALATASGGAQAAEVGAGEAVRAAMGAGAEWRRSRRARVVVPPRDGPSAEYFSTDS